MNAREVAYMPLAEIVAAPRNPKRHDHTGIQASIDEHGLAELPLLDERTGRLVAGHGRIDRLAVMHAAGQDPPDGVNVDPASGAWLVPVIRGWSSRSDAAAEAYVIASNKLTMNGGWDTAILGPMLGDLGDQGLLELTGFDEAELAALLDNTPAETLPEEGDADVDDQNPTWGVVVVCRDEQEQVDLLRRLTDEGHTVKALMS